MPSQDTTTTVYNSFNSVAAMDPVGYARRLGPSRNPLFNSQ